MYSRNGRSMSAGEIRELYGISVRQLRSSEAVFRKEAFKRDKQRLKVVVKAIDNQMKLAEHMWDSAKSKFVRDHAEFVNPERGRVMYHKIGRVNAQPAEFIPPCIPVADDCPPHRQVTQGMREGEGVKEVFLARHSAHHRRPPGLELAGEERHRSLDNYHHVLINRRVSNACRPSSVKVSAVSSSACHGAVSPKSGAFSPKSGAFSPKSGAFSPSPTRYDVNHRSSHWKGAPCQPMCDKHSHYHRANSQAVDNGHFLKACMDENFPADRENNRRIENPYQHSDVNNNNGIHTDTGCTAKVDNSNTPLVTSARHHRKSLNRTISGGHTEKPDKEPAASHHYQTEKTKAAESRKKKKKKKKKDESRENTDRDSGIAPSGSDSPECLDVELLLRALTDQCNEILVKNKWYRAVEKALLLPPSDCDDPEIQLPWDDEPALRHRLSSGSLSSSTVSAVANISDNNNDVDKTVIQMVLQVFKELDQVQFTNLTEEWSAIMDKLMVVLKDLIRHTGTEVAEAVEKILKNDAKDKKYAVLFDWIKDISSTDVEQVMHKNKNLSQQSSGQKVNTTSNIKLTMDRSGKTPATGHSQENPVAQSLPKPPVILVVPPSRRQSKETVRRHEYPYHRSEKAVQIETVTTVNFGNDPSLRMHPSTNNNGTFVHHTENETHEQRKPTSFYQKPSKSFRRLSFNIESISGTTNKPKHLQSQEDEFLAPEQRQRSFSYSRLHSAESHHSQFPRPRVNSTGQQGRNKPWHHDHTSMRRHSKKMTTARSPSPPSKAKRQGHSKTTNSSEQNATSEVEEEAHKQRLETTETSLYTDRMGKTHLLTMRKASLSWACTREANVTVTRDDTDEEKDVLPKKEKKNTTDETNSSSPWACFKAATARPENPWFNSPHTTEEEEEEETGHQPDTRHGATSPAFSLSSFPAEKSQEEDSQSLHSHDQDTPDPTQPAEREGPQDEDEALWRKRLSDPQELTWASELSSDHKGQGLALFLLYHKEGNSARFRSVVLKVICINVLRAANEVYDDVLICDVKKCRYLRMPQGSLSDSQKELNLDEIFT